MKTFCVGLAGGLNDTLEKLDEMVKTLGPIEIISWVDSYYTQEQAFPEGCVPATPGPGPRLVRTVTYRRLPAD